MKSVLIIGLGQFGVHMAEKLMENDNEVMAIESSEARADACAELIPRILIGNACDERFMKGIGVKDFDKAVIAVGDDFQTALEITVILKDLGCKYIVARATNDTHKKLLLRNGADYVSYAERETAERLAISLAADNVFDFIELTPEIGIYEVAVPKSWVGRTIIKLDVRNRYRISILATKEDGKINPMPPAQYEFKGTENILVMGGHADVERLK